MKFVITFLLSLCSIYFAANSYQDQIISGWKVKVNNQLLSDHKAVTESALVKLAVELRATEAVLPAVAIKHLKEMSIWLEYNSPNGAPIQYHFSKKWLESNGYDPAKESSIEITAPEYFASNDSLPLLSCFASAYHQRVLGLSNKDILNAYYHARDEGIYPKKSPIIQSNTNYFSALSESYFISPPDMPREKIKKDDPQGYAVVERLWNLK